ncbi:helix-turn-helix domain-containing protein [Spongiactinospora sp. TRM90649]|uniref:AraC-like ligand-binding domain-containing protein n=1 Tax=Spongiactinospora sp. TRM90649 TaxID=3031114 RepID=UPI0023F7332B|nr:helix-turn-helix domain-containing protein [Spongiactinospora sp. TRM90649]MDF5754656.1 helix-turn-helix domain-containing protein [Spongiactinospora sp. TRM90649]
MAVLIRTSDVPAASRHDAWRAVVCDTLGPLDLRIAQGRPLSGQIDGGRLGPLAVGRVRTTTPHSVHRTRGLIRGDAPELYRVVLAVSGSPIVAQDDRDARLRPGEFAFYDFTRPYDLAYESAVRLAVFSVPHDALALPPGSLARLTATPFAPESGAAALAGPLLRRVAADFETYRPEGAARLAMVVTDLITAAVAERAEPADPPPGESRRVLLLEVRAFIERHLGDPDLNPEVVAAGNHISVRRLHRLFQEEETTVAAWIRHRRLERCRQDLADPAMRAMPVSGVGARWGLPDPAGFSRAFRQAYGVPPTEFRRAGVR